MSPDVHMILVRIIQKCYSITWDALEPTRRMSGLIKLNDALCNDLSRILESVLIDVKIGGVRLLLSPESLSSHCGDEAEITLHLPVPTTDCALVRNFLALLEVKCFLRETPKLYYEIDTSKTELPEGYADTIKFGTFLANLADHCEENIDGKKVYFYSGVKVDIPIIFTAGDVCRLHGLNKLTEEFIAPHLEERTKIFKSVVVKTVLNTPSLEQSFAYLLKSFERMNQIFRSDWALFISDFSMEKTLEALEEKTLKLADKITASLSDLQKTMITVPLAILFAAPRIEAGGNAHTLLNILTILSVWLFALFTWMFFYSHKRSLAFIVDEIREQKNFIAGKHPGLADKINPKFNRLEKRCRDQAVYRKIVGSLMWVAVLGATGTFYWPQIVCFWGQAQDFFSALSYSIIIQPSK